VKASLSDVITTLALVTAKALAYLASLNSEISPPCALSSEGDIAQRQFGGLTLGHFGADAPRDLGQGERAGALVKSVVRHAQWRLVHRLEAANTVSPLRFALSEPVAGWRTAAN